MTRIEAYGYFLVNSGTPLEKRNYTIDSIKDDQVVIEVAGCGLCGTDLSFISGNVKTRGRLPLIPGHEISGKAVLTGARCRDFTGKNFLVPSVIPCGDCILCKDGRGNICRDQLMPGNDINGGFSSHVVVPGRYLCELPDDTGTHRLSELCIISDAITTPYQSIQKSGLKNNDLAVIIGTGGIGIHIVQLASKLGAKVLALDIDTDRLDIARLAGADFTLDVKDMDYKDIKGYIRNLVKDNRLPEYSWKVFESSGTSEGQQTAISLLSFAGTILIVGFSLDRIDVNLSKLMAYDAEIIGSWGCRPELYPDALKMVLDDEINITDFIEEYPLDSINEIISMTANRELKKRAIFIP